MKQRIILLSLMFLLLSTYNLHREPLAIDETAHAAARSTPLYHGQDTAVDITPNNTAVVAYSDTLESNLVLSSFTVMDRTTSPKTMVLDTTDDVGTYADVVAVSNTDVLISYRNETAKTLKIARCTIPCERPTLASITSGDPDIGYGLHTSIAATTRGLAVVAHTDETGSKLYLTRCSNLSCSTSTTTTLTRLGGAVGNDISLALTTADAPVIAYAEAVDGNPDDTTLNVLICADAACSTSSVATIDSNGNTGRGLSMRLGKSQEPHISYFEKSTGVLNYARCVTATCASVSIATLNTDGHAPIDTAIDFHISSKLQLQPVISYGLDDATPQAFRVKAIMCPTTACTAPTRIDVPFGGYGHNIAMKILGNKTVISSYIQGTDVYVYNDGNYPIDSTTNRFDWELWLASPPPAFSKTTPNNGKIVVRNTSSTLKWNLTRAVDNYRYCFYLDTSSCTLWRNAADTGVVVVPTLAGTYLWQIKAVNRAGETLANNGTPWALVVKHPTPTGTPSIPPAPFTRTSPTNNATRVSTTTRLSWTASTRAITYEYCIATTSTCTTWVNVGANLSVAPPGLARFRTYYWQVRAKNRDGVATTATGGIWKFTTVR